MNPKLNAKAATVTIEEEIGDTIFITLNLEGDKTGETFHVASALPFSTPEVSLSDGVTSVNTNLSAVESAKLKVEKYDLTFWGEEGGVVTTWLHVDLRMRDTQR